MPPGRTVLFPRQDKGCSNARNARIEHVGGDAHRLPVVGQAAPAVGDIGNIQPHVVGKLLLKGKRIVLVARQRQPILRHCDHGLVVTDGRIDERRKLDAGTAARRVTLREPIVQQESRRLAVRSVVEGWVRLEAECRLPYELVERDPGVVDPIAPADGVLVSKPIGKTQPRAPSVVVRLFKRASSGRPGPFPAKIMAPGIFPAPGLGVLGSKVEYWSRLSVRANW